MIGGRRSYRWAMAPQTVEGVYENGSVRLTGAAPDVEKARVLVTFLPEPPPKGALDQAKGHDGERLALGSREIYVDYCGTLLGRSKLRIPAAAEGTGRNMNSVAKLARMAMEMALAMEKA